VIIEADYRGHRIEVIAQHVDGAWDAEVRIRRTFSNCTPSRSPAATRPVDNERRHHLESRRLESGFREREA
jgi:hypothetical protein